MFVCVQSRICCACVFTVVVSCDISLFYTFEFMRFRLLQNERVVVNDEASILE
jgi:hypothetical protein